MRHHDHGLFVLLLLLLSIELLTQVTPTYALKAVYCGLENEMASIGNNFTFYSQLDALYHQTNDIQISHLSPSSPTFASLPRGVVISTWDSNDTSSYACQLASHQKFCEKYNYTHRVFAGTEEFRNQVNLLALLYHYIFPTRQSLTFCLFFDLLCYIHTSMYV